MDNEQTGGTHQTIGTSRTLSDGINSGVIGDSDRFGFNSESPLSVFNKPALSGMTFDAQNEVQKSRQRYSGLVGTTSISAASGNVGTGNISVYTTWITPKIRANTNLAIPFVAIYEGTSAVGSMQIYPNIGAGIAAGKFQFTSGFDLLNWETNGTYPGQTNFVVQIYNVGGGTTANIYAQSQWKFTANNSGGQS